MASPREIEYHDPTKLVIIGLDTDDRDEHPLFDERAFREVPDSLIKNILFYGIQLPVLIRKDAGNLVVVDGRQRVKAAREAIKRASEAGDYEIKVPCRVSGGDDARVAGVMISTNEQRFEDDVLAKAFKAVRIMNITGKPEDEVAIDFGRSVTTIRNWVSFAGADPKIHAAYREGKLSAQAGVELSKLSRAEQATALEDLLKQMAGGAPVSESKAKKKRQEATGKGGSSGAEAGGGGDGLPPAVDTQTKGKKGKKGKADPEPEPAPEPAPPSRRGSTASQQGIKRTWLRKAIKTEAAGKLSEDQLKVLRWFAFGESAKGDWFDDFRFDAEAELGN